MVLSTVFTGTFYRESSSGLSSSESDGLLTNDEAREGQFFMVIVFFKINVTYQEENNQK